MADKVTVTAPAGYLVSSNGTDFAASVELVAVDGAVSANITVRFAPVDDVAYNANLTVSSAFATTQEVALSGNGIDRTGISQTIAAQISVYPTPSNGQFKVQLPQQAASAVIVISDVAGRVTEVRNANGSQQVEFDLSNKAKGLYLITIRVGDSSIVKRMIIE